MSFRFFHEKKFTVWLFSFETCPYFFAFALNTEKQIIHPLLHSPNVFNRQRQTRLEPEAMNCTVIFHMGNRSPRTGFIVCCLQMQYYEAGTEAD